MLPESQVSNAKNLPPEPAKLIRIRFQKIGNLQFISHLDLQRTLQRILVRADVPLWYTKGFNPHMKIVFSTPLSIGSESVCEMVDIRLAGDISPSEFAEKINEQVTDELRILDAYVPDTKFSDIIWSRYKITLYSPTLSESSVQKMYDILRQEELLTTKKTKSGEKIFNVIPLVRNFFAQFDAKTGEVYIETLLRADGENYLNPELFLSCMRRFCGALNESENQIQYRILRVENYFEDGETVFR